MLLEKHRLQLLFCKVSLQLFSLKISLSSLIVCITHTHTHVKRDTVLLRLATNCMCFLCYFVMLRFFFEVVSEKSFYRKSWIKMTHCGVKQSHYGIRIGAVLSLLAATHGHYCLLAGVSFSQSPLSLPFTPSLSLPSAISPLNFIPIHLDRW